jgi:hypothetical protein
VGDGEVKVTERPTERYATLIVAATLGFAMGYMWVALGFPGDSVGAILVGTFFGVSWVAIAAALDVTLGHFLSYIFYGGAWMRFPRGQHGGRSGVRR